MKVLRYPGGSRNIVPLPDRVKEMYDIWMCLTKAAEAIYEGTPKSHLNCKVDTLHDSSDDI